MRMGISIGTNISSIAGQINLSRATQSQSKTFERLSSGKRINRASDDAAGLAMAEKLNADSRIAGVALRNANDGISTIGIFNTSANEISSVLTRMTELATQAANGSVTNQQRSSLDAEFKALGSEIVRIRAATEFNGSKFLETQDTALMANNNAIGIQIGFKGVDNNSVINITGTQPILNNIGTLNFSLNDTTTAFAQSAAQNALDHVKNVIGSIATVRGILGSTESRLNVVINNLMVSRENFLAAESAIRDADVAEEAASLTRTNILQQSGTAVLAQANQQPGLALSLLG
jgi:flagellin